MKQKLFLSLFVFLVGILTTNAQNEDRMVISAGNFKSLEFSDNLKVILIPTTNADPSISMNDLAIENLNITLKGESLRVESRRPFSKSNTVYVEVNAPEQLTLGEKTIVQTHGILNSPKMDVYIYDGAKVHLKMKGKVKAYPMGNEQVMIKRGFFKPAEVAAF